MPLVSHACSLQALAGVCPLAFLSGAHFHTGPQCKLRPNTEGITSNSVFITGNQSIEKVVVRNSTTELSFEATSGSDCGAAGSTKVHMIPLQDVHNQPYGEVKFTAYWFTEKKVYSNTTHAGTGFISLATNADFLLSGGATIIAWCSLWSEACPRGC
jgi:hypothetical protein